MMLVLVFNILQKLAPVLFIAGLFAAVYWQGYHTAEQQGLEREAQIQAESRTLIAQAHQRNADIQAQAEQSAHILGETYEKNHQTITDLSTANTELIAKLRQQFAASSRKSRLPNATGATVTRHTPDTGDGKLLESLVDSARVADEATETARACQSTLTTYQELINGSTRIIY